MPVATSGSQPVTQASVVRRETVVAWEDGAVKPPVPVVSAAERWAQQADKSGPIAEQGDVELGAPLNHDRPRDADQETVRIFRERSQHIRLADRKLGAVSLYQETRVHLESIRGALLRSKMSQKPLLEVTLAEAATLAAWQAIDLGKYEDAQSLYSQAQEVSVEGGHLATLAHATAEEANVFLDQGLNEQALALVESTDTYRNAVPSMLRAWLSGMKAEVHAAMGDEQSCRREIEQAWNIIPAEPDGDLPYLALDPVHLTRWSGNCLARLGVEDALEDLADAVAKMDQSFTRAQASLRCDLAQALAAHGDLDGARHQALQAGEIARSVASARQLRRIGNVVAILANSGPSRP
jgi:tetratricopeptide (TPR) repeat protein